MSLDIQCTLARDYNPDIDSVCDDNTDIPPTTTDESTNIPVHRTIGTQIYRLQKQIEEVLGQCRTLAFLNNDIPPLEAALEQGKTIALKLREAATIPGGENCPPTFKVLAAAGADEFRKNRKTIHRAGGKCKSRYTEGISQPKKQKCNTVTNILLEVKRNKAGRPKLKRSQRRKPVLLRQISSEAKQKIKQAAAIIQRGIQSPNNLPVSHVCTHVHTYTRKYTSMQACTHSRYTYVCTNASCTHKLMNTHNM